MSVQVCVTQVTQECNNMCVLVCVIPVIYKSVTIFVCRCVLHGMLHRLYKVGL